MWLIEQKDCSQGKCSTCLQKLAPTKKAAITWIEQHAGFTLEENQLGDYIGMGPDMTLWSISEI